MLRVTARVRVFWSNSLGLDQIETLKDLRLVCDLHDNKEDPLSPRVPLNRACGFNLWLGLHVLEL